MQTTISNTPTETLPKNLNQVLAVAEGVFKDPAATSCYIDTTFGEVRAERSATGGRPEIFMASLEYTDFCRFLKN